MNQNIGIVIKTCSKDHEWLKYCLLSIKKNAHNFAGICLITEPEHSNIEEYQSICDNTTIVTLDIPKAKHSCQDGLGYLWMQNIKLNWHHYCSFDTILQIDSDCLISAFLSPDYFLIDNKWKWLMRPWNYSEEAYVHKKPLAKFLQQDTDYEHMPYNGWILTREDTINFHKWMEDKYRCTWWDYLLNHTQEDWGKLVADDIVKHHGFYGRLRGSSVYNAYGGFLYISNTKNYCFIDTSIDIPQIYPITQYWSWGGIDNKINTDIQSKLNQMPIEKCLENTTLFDKFDDAFYICQFPNAYGYLSSLPDQFSNKQKLFYHFTMNNNPNKFLNQPEYEKSVVGQMNIPKDFDEFFYAKTYPDTHNYFVVDPPISNRTRLYHHFINHGCKFPTPCCPNVEKFIEQSKKNTISAQEIA